MKRQGQHLLNPLSTQRKGQRSIKPIKHVQKRTTFTKPLKHAKKRFTFIKPLSQSSLTFTPTVCLQPHVVSSLTRKRTTAEQIPVRHLAPGTQRSFQVRRRIREHLRERLAYGPSLRPCGGTSAGVPAWVLRTPRVITVIIKPRGFSRTERRSSSSSRGLGRT